MPHRPRRTALAIVLTASLTGVGIISGHAALGSAPPGLVLGLTTVPTSPPTATVAASPTVPLPPTSSVSSSPGPAAPRNVAVVAHATSLTVTWTASSGAIDHYDLYYLQSFSDNYYFKSSGNVTSTTLTSNVTPRTQYRVLIAAVDVAGLRSPMSEQVNVVTPASDTAPDQTPPTSPKDLKVAEYPETGAVRLSWSPSTDDVGVTGYIIYSAYDDSASRIIAPTQLTTFTVSLGRTGPNGEPHDEFFVRATDAAGNVSLASASLLVRPSGSSSPGPPSSEPASSPPPPTCAITYHPLSTWADGFVAEVTVTNRGTSTLTDWTATFHFGGDQQIATSWNGAFRQSGADVALGPPDWNRSVAPGRAATVGLFGSYRTSAAAPSVFAVNGKPCQDF
ncbi:cellulose binding domain-containing protein [Actinoplanes sp. KI2]|uniref:cellulose binding domain-containing protein n=1 Tax=Actinoplanes sp. KI2 TaxID=2983315 RepID=UPI0021D5DDEF|nr:cellulose binding domain-containing protein [Actinoplanes sp. KI2]MCU7725606.1 cellulose binding domain-containing protein [Actinoplanes sp. KI2]